MTNYFPVLAVAFLHTTVSAFSSIAYPSPNDGAHSVKATPEVPFAATTTYAPWRIVLDVGREPLSSMPFDWARSGCRMPLVIPCDFGSDQSVIPQSDTVSFTGPDGAVVRPIQGGSWKLTNNDKQLSLSLSFPETLSRRDVSIPAGTTITLEATVYTKAELDLLNAEFYEARDIAWKVGGELNEMNQRQEAPKKWNEEKRQWEKRYPTENLLSMVQKRAALWGAQAEQNKKNQRRPNPNTLSTGQGTLPGVESDIFIQKGGIVKIRNNNKGPLGDAVIGKWSAEPIIPDKVVSYYN